jgi:DNA-directed RNA polymerase specialized sigma24 family protein
MIRSNVEIIENFIGSTFEEFEFEIQKEELNSLVTTISKYIDSATMMVNECGLEEGDFISPVWEGVSYALNSINNQTVNISYFATCVRNKIFDVCRSARSKKNIPLNNGLQNMLIESRRVRSNASMNANNEVDPFDHQTKEVIERKLKNKEYYQTTLALSREVFESLKSTSKDVISLWNEGVRNGMIAVRLGITTKKVASTIADFIETTRKKLAKYIED